MGKLLILLLLVIQSAKAQVVVSGLVTNDSSTPLAAASVTLIKKNGIVLAFVITKSSGEYRLQHLTANLKDSLFVSVSAMGFTQQLRPVTTTEQYIDFRLVSSKDMLPDVMVISRPMLRKAGDTLTYDVASFSDKQDRVIGDLIKKLPGIDVDEKGQISYGGKPINRFYIENDNLLDGRYNIATRSIPTDAVSKVQVLEKHQPTKVLKDMLHSDQAAINIVLKDKSKLRLLGTGDAAAGTPGVYNASVNLMLFQKRVKFINYIKLNNTGNDLSDEIYNFFDWENTPPSSLMSASTAGSPDISKRRSLFNNAGVVTTNNLVNLAKDWQLRVNTHFLQDKQFQSYRYKSAYYLSNDTIRYNEVLDSRRSIQTFNTQLTLTANRDNFLLNNVTTLENETQTISSNLVATGNGAVAQQLTGNNTNISNRFNLIKKINSKSSYELYSFINHISNPSALQVNPGLFETQLNGGIPYAGLEQTGVIPTTFTDNYLGFGIPGTKLKQQYRIGFNYQGQQLNSSLLSEQISGSKQIVADSFVNRMNWQRLRTYVQADYSYETEKLILSLSLPWFYQNIHYQGRTVDRNLYHFPVNPKLYFRYTMGKKDFISLGYAYSNTWGSIEQVYDGYIMRNYRDFYSNGYLLNETRSHNFSASYDFKNTLKIFFFSIGATYGILDRNTISQQQISSVIQQSRLIPFDNRTSMMSINSATSKYVFSLMTTIGGKFRWSKIVSNQFQNGELFALQNNTYTFGWNSNTKFGSWLTLGYTGSFTSGTSGSKGAAKKQVAPSIQKWLHAADASITFNKHFTAKLVADNYTYLLPNAQDTRVTFADIYLTYYMDKLKTNIEFSLTNIMGTDTYSNLSLAANSISETVYTIRPRMALLKFYFRF